MDGERSRAEICVADDCELKTVNSPESSQISVLESYNPWNETILVLTCTTERLRALQHLQHHLARPIPPPRYEASCTTSHSVQKQASGGTVVCLSAGPFEVPSAVVLLYVPLALVLRAIWVALEPHTISPRWLCARRVWVG